MVNQHHSQAEFVKCVVVGDSGVGKTCLVCAWSCRSKYTLKQLVKTHVASVWAIDHYRTDREVLERSWVEVDGACVSLRLWDTFGYHDKDRRFAYGRADVVMLCFSTVNPISLRNVKKVWFPEIRQYCPTTPIVLVGTHSDMRYLYKDEAYIKLEKGLLYRPIEEKDLITPEQGRDVAVEIGAPYYETSVLTEFGVDDVFTNCVRAALIERRKVKFWVSQLRKLKYPMLQAPMLVPQPNLPTVVIALPTLHDDLDSLLHNQSEGDSVFIVHGRCFRAHKICLMVAANVFQDLFVSELNNYHSCLHADSQDQAAAAADDNDDDGGTDSSSDKDQLLVGKDLAMDDPLSCTGFDNIGAHANVTPAACPEPVYFIPTHPAFHSVEVKLCVDPFHPDQSMAQTLITINPDITPRAFQYILEYLYTGRVKEQYEIFDEVKIASELLQLNDLKLSIANYLSQEGYLNAELERQFRIARCVRLRNLALDKRLAVDVTFQVDDGVVYAHKPLLMARCEVMCAMFSNDFLESSAKVIPFPGICQETFKVLQEYLYTGETPLMLGMDCMDIIEVANRLCLPRLVGLTEDFVVKELMNLDAAGEEILEETLLLLEPAQLHNALQLAKWCLQYLCIRFQDIFPRYMKLYKKLQLENQVYIDKNRWPPAWNLKEVQYFKHLISNPTNKQKQQQHQRFSRWQRCTSSCLCFTRRHRASLPDISVTAVATTTELTT